MNRNQQYGLIFVAIGVIFFTGLANAYIPSLQLSTIPNASTTTGVVTTSVSTSGTVTKTITTTSTATTSVTCSPPIIYSAPQKCPKTVILGGGATLDAAELLGAVIAILGAFIYVGKRVPSV